MQVRLPERACWQTAMLLLQRMQAGMHTTQTCQGFNCLSHGLPCIWQTSILLMRQGLDEAVIVTSSKAHLAVQGTDPRL